MRTPASFTLQATSHRNPFRGPTNSRKPNAHGAIKAKHRALSRSKAWPPAVAWSQTWLPRLTALQVHSLTVQYLDAPRAGHPWTIMERIYPGLAGGAAANPWPCYLNVGPWEEIALSPPARHYSILLILKSGVSKLVIRLICRRRHPAPEWIDPIMGAWCSWIRGIEYIIHSSCLPSSTSSSSSMLCP